MLLLERLAEFLVLLRQGVGLWDKVEGLLPKLLLHAIDVHRKTVLSGDFGGVHEVVDLLELVQSFIHVGPLMHPHTCPQ